MKEKITGLVPHFNVLMFMTVATVGTFVGGVWAIAGISGALILFIATAFLDRRIPRPSNDLAALAVIALAVMALLNLQSSQPAISWFEWRRLGTIFLPLLLFTCPAVQARAGHPKLFVWLPVAATFGAVALSLELVSGGAMLKALKGPQASLTEYNRGLSYLVILAFPILAALKVEVRGQRLEVGGKFLAGLQPLASSLIFILVLLFPAGLTESRSAKLALIVGLAVTAFAYFWPVFTRRGLAAVPVIFLGWPFAAQEFFRTHYVWLAHFPDSWHHRVEIWDYMSYRIMERPWLGWGLGSAHTLDFHNPDGAKYVFATIAASHPHNAVTQLWVELGLPGLALGLAFALVTLRKAARLDPRLAPFALGAWAAGLCLTMVAYSLWTDSLFAAFALAGFAFALLVPKVKAAK